MRRLFRFAVIALLALSALSYLHARRVSGPAVWQRDASGVFSTSKGSPPLTFSASSTSSECNFGGSSLTVSHDHDVEQPLRLSSITIVGFGGSGLEGEVAHTLAAEARSVTSVQRVDVRSPGRSAADDLLGDQILVFEVLRASSSLASSWSPVAFFDVTVDGWIGHAPEFGWGEGREMRQRIRSDWRLDVRARHIGLPFTAPSGVGEAIGGSIELEEYAAELSEAGPVAPPFPAELVAETTDLGTSDEAVRALGVDTAPIYAGRRHLRKGEALWRYEGADAVDRLEAAIETLREAGWQEGAGGHSMGVDGRTHHFTLRRGEEFVRLQYQENRVGRFQSVSWTSTWTPIGGQSPTTKHVDGDPIDPVVWLYYRHEVSAEELGALHARARALGPDQLGAFEANLPLTRAEELGVNVARSE